MDRQPYIDGKVYERLMQRAYPNQKTKRNGVDSTKMAYLIEAENGSKFYGLPSRQKQLENVKTYLSKAVAKFKTLDWTTDEFRYLLNQEDSIDSAGHSSQLLYAINELLELTDKFHVK
ncbi:MAG: hypothetical protein V4643_05220 [Bacteroidota bacterium]